MNVRYIYASLRIKIKNLGLPYNVLKRGNSIFVKRKEVRE